MLQWLFSIATVVGFVVLLWAVVVLVALIKADGDLKLMFYSKYGKKVESLAGKVVWITGSSSGIGESMAYILAKAGCRLVLSARREDELERVKRNCLDSGKISSENVLVLPIDVMKTETHKAAVKKVIEHFSQIDILVNNAGRSQRAAWLDVELDVDRDMFELNVLGQVSLTQEVLPHMIDRKQGHIAVTSSMAGIMGAPLSRSYTGTKHAIHGYFGCLRTEMGEHNIGVTLTCPGPVFSNILGPSATGKVGEIVGRDMAKTEKRMTAERCAYLSCVAIANNLYEVWMALQPFIYLLYLTQYFPDAGRWLLVKFGLKRIMKMREGK